MEEPILDYYKSYFSPAEIDIAGILLQLPGLVTGIETRIRHRVRWGRKKRRSAVPCKHKSTLLRIRLPAPASPTSPSRPKNPEVNPGVNVVKDESTSPTTPLLFDPEETPPPTQLRSRVVSGKRKIVLEDWQKEVDGLKKQKQLLQKEIQKVEDHKEGLINDNLLLQSRKQQLQNQIQEEAQLQIQKQSSNLDTQLGQASPAPSSVVMFATAVVQQEHSHHHQQIIPHLYQTTMTVQTAQIQSAVIGENQSFRASDTQMTSTSLSCDSVKATGVTLVSCNNNGGLVRVAECGYSFPHQNQSSSLPNPDLYKAMAKAQCAQRRQERYQKNRVKKTSHLGQK